LSLSYENVTESIAIVQDSKMKYSRSICQTIARIILALLISSLAIAFAETPDEMNSWTFHKEWDKSSNLHSSLARSPMPKRGLYDNLRLEIVCKNNKLQFSLDANSLITSRGRSFDFEYQIDNKSPIIIQMKTYSDSKRRGFTDEKVERIVESILSGQSMFIRIPTLIRTVLSGAIPLENADQPIQQVLSDCGVVLPNMKVEQSTYSLADFERDIKKLSPEQQGRVLNKIKEMMTGIR